MIAKADIRRVQEWMGHADVATTMKYLHDVERPDEAALVAEAFALEPVSPNRRQFSGMTRLATIQASRSLRTNNVRRPTLTCGSRRLRVSS